MAYIFSIIVIRYCWHLLYKYFLIVCNLLVNYVVLSCVHDLSYVYKFNLYISRIISLF